jgi:hypothetical protein
MKITKWIETKRAPKRSDNFGRTFVPSGIDIYSTDNPEYAALDKFDRKSFKASDLLDAIEEIKYYRTKTKLHGEKIELSIELVDQTKKDEGDIYQYTGSIKIKLYEKDWNYIELTPISSSTFNISTFTAEIESLKQALIDYREL